MKIFVTGCAGLLGANYTRHLIQNGHHVVGIDDLSGGHKAFITKGENFEFVKLNLEKRKVNLSMKLLEEIEKKEALEKYGSEGSGKNLPFSSLSEDLKKKGNKKK